MYARPFIDSLDFAKNGRQIHGKVPVAGMPRLLDMLEDADGELEYTLLGGVDKSGHPLLGVNITGNFRLLCQRCLNGMDYALRLDSCLLLRDQASLDALDASGEVEEEFDSILADASLDVLDLLEEEVLLSLPLAPCHEFGTCQVATNEDKHNHKANPFAVLANFKE